MWQCPFGLWRCTPRPVDPRHFNLKCIVEHSGEFGGEVICPVACLTLAHERHAWLALFFIPQLHTGSWVFLHTRERRQFCNSVDGVSRERLIQKTSNPCDRGGQITLHVFIVQDQDIGSLALHILTAEMGPVRTVLHSARHKLTNKMFDWLVILVHLETEGMKIHRHRGVLGGTGDVDQTVGLGQFAR